MAINRRLWLAYLVAPWGALFPAAVFAVLLVAVSLVGRSRDGGIDLIDVTAVITRRVLLLPVAVGYVVGAFLLPVYFAFERRDWRGWRYYVPAAIIAALFTVVASSILSLVWSMARVARSRGGGIGAVSFGCGGYLVEAIGAVVCATACGVLFSIVLDIQSRRRPN